MLSPVLNDKFAVLPYILLIGIAVPVVEILLLLWMAEAIGFWMTVGIIFITGGLGATLWRYQGIGVLGRLRQGIHQKQSPGDALMDGAMIFFAGGLLLTPGILTDLVGFSLLIPWNRKFLRNRMKAHFSSRFQFMNVAGSHPFQAPPFAHRGPDNDLDTEGDDIVEGEILSRTILNESEYHLSADDDQENRNT
ncbi:MAG: FxsA family protein [Pirellulaceae bacterium]|nr:FxsA family protein [Pirellulaceae bacterium]